MLYILWLWYSRNRLCNCVVYLSSNRILSTDTVLTNNPKASNGQGWCNLVEITINGFVKYCDSYVCASDIYWF